MLLNYMSQNNIKPNKYYIPENYKSDNEFMGVKIFKIRNLIEATCVGVSIWFIISIIPFTQLFTIIFSAILILPAVIFFLVGIKGMSVTEYIIVSILYKKNKCEYEMGMPEKKSEKEKD